MNRWDGFRRWEFEAGTKKKPPEHGIKMNKAGTTWWGQHWIEALERVLGAESGRLSRGRTYARAGRTHDLEIEGGTVVAKVTGSRPKPYDVTIELPKLSEKTWQQVIARMAEKAQFVALLLAGEMPREIDDVFRAAGTSLFPEKRADLETDCSCPDDGDPCKHIAATHYVLGEALDRDPFLLFELRGKPKAAVLEALRKARGGAPAEDSAPPENARGKAKKAKAKKQKPGGEAAVEDPAPRTVKVGKIKPADYDRPRGALPSLHFSFDAPKTHGSVLKQLGAPAAWRGESAPAAVFGPLVERAAEAARKLAMRDDAQDENGDTAGDDAKRHRR